MKTICCLNCSEMFETRESHRKFCSKRCAAIKNNSQRIHSEDTKRKISAALKGRCVGFSRGKERKPRPCKCCNNPFIPENRWRKYCSFECSLTGRNRKNLGKMSYRTFRKILGRAFPDWKCPFCEWTATFDVHHIYGRNDNRAISLVMLCPNHHSLADRKILEPEKLLPHAIGKTFSAEDLLRRFYKGGHNRLTTRNTGRPQMVNLQQLRVEFDPSPNRDLVCAKH
jgi:hypothetical protein